MFAGEDGLCRPSIDSCPVGSIPKFGEGCVAVGIADCPAEFLEPDGICHPSMHKCPTGTFAVPTVGCVALDDCGSGTWGNITDATIWVDPTFVGGNGTTQQPFATIADALLAATPGSRIALAAGDYDEPVTLDMPIELLGRCASMVSIRGTQPTLHSNTPVILLIDGAQDVRVSGVRLTGAGVGVLVNESEATLSEVHVDRATGFGVTATLSTIALERMLIEQTLANDGQGGQGVQLLTGAQASIQQSALFRNREAGLGAGAPSTITVSESLIEETLANADSFWGGFGITLSGGASLYLEASALVANRNGGIGVHERGTSATVKGSLVEKTLPNEESLAFGYGISAGDGAHLTLESSAVLHNRAVGLFASGMGTTASVSGSLVAATQPEQADLAHGSGIAVQQGASLTLDTSAVVDNHFMGIIILSSEPETTSSAVITQTLVERTHPQQSDGMFGVAMAFLGDGDLTLSDSIVRQAHTTGVLVTSRASAEIVTSRIDEIRATPLYDANTQSVYQGIGYGIAIAFEASANITDTAVHRADQAAVLYESSTGVLRGVRTSESPIGLVLQGEPHPDWQHDSNSFEGDVLENTTSPVPGELP